MRIRYERSFLKDLSKIKDAQLKKRVQVVIDEVKEANSRSEVVNLEKLKESDTAFKIRIGNYRVGIFYENEEFIFSRFLHREEIYKKFPR